VFGSPTDLIGDNHFIGGVCKPSFLGPALDILMKFRPRDLARAALIGEHDLAVKADGAGSVELVCLA
jgi:hypothetical protein